MTSLPNADENESIETFLERLKLSDKYLETFISNGYWNVNQCRGITEDRLKEIGVVPPGHYRRILSKLPGCSVAKPPRMRLPQVTAAPPPTPDPAFTQSDDSAPFPPLADYSTFHPPPLDSEIPDLPPPDDYEPEDVYLLDDDDTCGNGPPDPGVDYSPVVALTTPTPAFRGPQKPMRSPDHIRIPHSENPLSLSESIDVYNHLNEPPPKAQKSPTSLSEAVFKVLRESPQSGSPRYSSSDDSEDGDDDDLGAPGLPGLPGPIQVPDLRVTPIHEGVDNPHSNSNNKSDSLKSGSGPDWEVLSPDHGLAHMVLPSPPPPVWMSGDEGGFPSPPPPKTPSPSLNLQEGEYDRLNMSRNGVSPQKNHPKVQGTLLEDPSATYELLDEEEEASAQSKVLRSISNYEEVDLESSSAGSWEAPGGKTPPVLISPVDPAKQIRRTPSKEERPVGRPKTADLGVLGREVNHVGDVYSVAGEADPENVYSELEEVGQKKRSVDLSVPSSYSLPRSSGSLPASMLQMKISPQLMTHRLNKQPQVSLEYSEESGDDNLDDSISIDEEADGVYYSIGEEPGAPVFTRKLKTDSHAMSIKRKGPHLKLGRKMRGARPLSAFVDSFKFGRQGTADDNLDGSDSDLHQGHSRSQSTTSDRKSDLVDVQIPEEGRIKVPDNVALLSPLSLKKTKKGWLNKHGWHEGRAPIRKRWVVFDGDELSYYENEKAELSKGIIPIEVVLRVQVAPSEPKVFHILTKGGRKYIFSADTTDDSSLWTSTLVAAKMLVEKQGPGQFKPGGSMYMPYKEGFLKMDGSRQKTYLATKGDQLAYYKSNNEFIFGQPVAKLSMKLAAVKELDKKKFQVVFPYRTFTFIADNEEEKRSWVEALSDAIAEALSDYKVVTEVWSLPENRKCADCGRDDPDWASINLAIVICKHCAGVHRDLGVHNSKVRSLKMDVRIWDDSMKMLFLASGNLVANKFWARNLPPGEAISDMADKKQRAWHITSKYIEMQFAEMHRHSGNQVALNQDLTNAVRQNNLQDIYNLVFSGADPNCDTGLENTKKTPFKLAQCLGASYTAITEFLKQNGATEIVSPEGHVTNRSSNVSKKDSFPRTRTKPPVTLRDCLWKFGGDFKNANEDQRRFGLIRNALQQGDFQKRMCVLENNWLKYYDPEKTNVLKDDVDCSELISIGICQPEQATKSGFQFCFEVGRLTGRTYLFCADRKETYVKWTRGLLQAILPPHVQNALNQEFDYDRVGKVWIKTQHWAKKTSEWTSTWCRLKGKSLYYFHQDSRTMERIDLRKLVQIGLDQTNDGTGISVGQSNTIPVFMLVFKEKTYYFHSHTRPDTETWLAAIKKADGDCGPRLEDQQLTSEGVPIILEKCMTYIEQYGLKTRGIYRLSGTHTKTTQLLSDFKQNARDTQMHEGEINVHDVANALKRWFKSLPGSLLTEHLHNQWIETTQIKDEHRDRKLEWYKHLVDKMPEINRNTLKNVLVHLNNVASHEGENDMSTHNLAIVFGPTLMEPQADDGAQFIGQTSLEIGCIEDLIKNYGWLFDVTEVDLEKERLMLEAKGKISQATQQQNMLTTLDYDMMVPIYINSKEDKCVNYKVNMNAGALVSRICSTHGYPTKTWGLYEVILDGDAERPLHYSEHVLSVIKSWEMPSTNYLVAKHDYIRDKMRWFQQTKSPEMNILCEGQLKTYETKKKWVKVNASLRVTDDALTMQYAKNTEGASVVRDMTPINWRKRSAKQQRNLAAYDEKVKGHTTLPMTNYNVYLGVASKPKPPVPRKSGFTLASRGEVTRQFCAESESLVYRWMGHILLHKHPEGITPPDSPKVESPKEETPPRRTSDSSRRAHYPPLSQQDLGEAVRQAALRRQSSAGSDEMSRDNVSASDTSTASAFDSEPVYVDGAQPPPITPRGLGAVQRQSSFESGNRRTSSTLMRTPAPDGGQRAVLGMKLHSELSSVLKKRTH